MATNTSGRLPMNSPAKAPLKPGNGSLWMNLSTKKSKPKSTTYFENHKNRMGYREIIQAPKACEKGQPLPRNVSKPTNLWVPEPLNRPAANINVASNAPASSG